MGRRLIVEFTSEPEALDFRDEVLEHRGINSYSILSAEPYEGPAVNTVNGSTAGPVVQCGGDIEGGVHL